jgi:hypothetical protein
VNFVHPAAFTRDKTQRDGFIRFAFGRREQAVPGGERQIRGDKRGGTEITAGGFQLPNRIPGIVRGVADRFSVVVTKNSVLISFALMPSSSAWTSAGNREIEHSNNRTSLRISLSGEIIMYIESSSRFKFMKVKNNFN